MWISLSGGCGKSVTEIASSVKDATTKGLEQAKETASQVGQTVTEQAQNVTGQVQEGLALAGTMTVNMGGPLQTQACYVTLVPAAGGRPAVLQLQSYQDEQQESFPSVFARATVPAAGLSELAGQTIPAQMFVQPQAGGPVWHSQASPIQLKIHSVDEKQVAGEILAGALADAATGQTQPVSGTFQGVSR
jgi:hypothetical protein